MPDNRVVVVIGGDNQSAGAFAELGKSLDGLLESVGGLSGLLEGLSLEEVIRRFAEFTAQVLESDIGLTRMAASTGIAIEELGGLALAAKMSGVSTEEFEGSLRKFATTLSNAASGNVQARQALEALGIAAKDASGNVLSIQKALAEVADKFAATRDGTNKAALAVQLFGRQGLDMIPILDKGSKGIAEMNAKAEELHLTLSKADQEALKQFDEDLGFLRASGEGATQQFLRGLIPALDEVVRAANDLVGGFKEMKGAGEALGLVIKTLATGVLGLFTILSTSLQEAATPGAWESISVRLKKIWTDIWGSGAAAAKASVDAQKAEINRIPQDAEAIRKLMLQQEIDGYKQAAQLVAVINAAELQNLEETYKAELISVQDYFDQKRQLQLESLQVAKYNAQQESDALARAAAHAPSEKDRLEILRQQSQVTEQIAELTAKIYSAQGNNPATGEIDELVQMARQAEIYTAEAKQVGEQIDAIFADLAEKTQAVQTAVEDYQMTVLQGETKINALRDQARQKLAGIVDQYGKLALASGDPKLVANADKFEKKVDELGIHLDSLRKEAIQGATQDFESFFTGLFDGTQRGASAFEAFGKSLIKTLAEIQAKMLAVWIIQKALGWLSSISGGGSGGASSSLGEGSDEAAFVGIGSHAAGGPVSAGDWSWVGEEGPELVKFGSSATVIPHSASVSMASGGGGDTYYQDFRGADAGMLQQVQNMIRVSEERSVARAKIEFLDMQRRRA
jgi:hypothetical protein